MKQPHSTQVPDERSQHRAPLAWRKSFKSLLCLWLGVALQSHAQQRTTGGAGFGAVGAVGGVRAASTTGTGSTTRQYPNNTTIGDAYFSIDPETRRIIYIADEATAHALAQVLTNLDRPKPQVLIKVVFVEVTHNNASDIGVEGGWSKDVGNNTTPTAVNGFGLSQLSSIPGTNFNQFGQPISSFAPVSPMTSYGAGMYQIMGQNYQVTIRAIAQAGNAKVLSRPSILARNNQPASIQVGQNVPLIQSVSYNGLNGTPINAYEYTPVGVILKVTPFITADNMVEMIIAPTISSIDPTLTVPITAGVNAPVIDIRSADTVAVTGDGQTVVIGGLIQDSKSTTDTKIPVLGDLPLFGPLFKRSQKSDTKTELIIFLTPHIVETPSQLAALSGAERAKSRAIQGLSEDQLDQFLNSLPSKPPAAPNGKKHSN